MKFGIWGFSRVLISKIASIFSWNNFLGVYSGFLGLLSLCLKVIEIESWTDFDESWQVSFFEIVNFG